MITLSLLVSFMLWVNSVTPIHDQEIFLQAQKAYSAKEYEKALSLYESLDQKSATIFSNMAASYYKMGSMLDALLYAKKAEKAATFSEFDHARRAVFFVQRELGLTVPNNTFSERVVMFFTKLSRIFSLLGWQLLCLGIVIVWCLCGRWRSIRLVFMMPLMVCILCMVCVMRTHKQEGLVYQDSSLYVGPDIAFASKLTLEKGIVVTIKKNNEQWYQVWYDNTVGWLPNDSVRLI